MSDVNKRVTGIQGVNVSRTRPEAGQVLSFDGTEYIPTTLIDPDTAPSGPASGDLSGDYPGPNVVNLTGDSSNIVNFPATPLAGDPTIVFNTAGSSFLKSKNGGNIEISTDAHEGGWNGDVVLNAGTAADSSSGSCRNVVLTTASNNDTNNGCVLISAGAGVDTGQYIVFDSLNTPGDYVTSQMGLNSKSIHFNGIGICHNQIVNVGSDYTINNGRSSNYDYIVLADVSGGTVTVTLPPSPDVGDTYVIGDNSGNAGSTALIVDGDEFSIDGFASHSITNAYGVITVTFTGVFWKIINKA